VGVKAFMAGLLVGGFLAVEWFLEKRHYALSGRTTLE
jgi:hypothetical protein